MAGRQEFVEQLFESALALEPTEREDFLDRVCGDDPELRRRVEELLAEDKAAGSFLEHPPFDFPEQSGPPRADGTTGSIDADLIHSLLQPAAGRLSLVKSCSIVSSLSVSSQKAEWGKSMKPRTASCKASTSP